MSKIQILTQRRLWQYVITTTVFCATMYILTSYASATSLFDLLVNVKLEQNQIELGQKPVIFGRVTDQALRPVPNVEVKITFSDNSATTTTDSNGNFEQEFSKQTAPGIFIVNVFARYESLKGFGSTTITISKQVTTFDELYYNSKLANVTDQKNKSKIGPYELLKNKNYEKFLNDQTKKRQKQLESESKKLALQEERSSVKRMINQTLVERNIGTGNFSGEAYNRYISKLDPRIKDSILDQINYTEKTYTDAQIAMKKILDNGGTIEDARKLYLEKLSTKRDQMESKINGTENHSTKKHSEKINSKKVKGLTTKKLYP